MNGSFLIAASIYWHFPILLVLVSLVYSATRHDDWRVIWHHAVRGMIYIVVFMGSVFIVLWTVSTLLPLLI